MTDVDRAKAFYVEQVGFHADHDHQVNDGLRFVQLTPTGSACSTVLGTGITQMPPGSQKGVQMRGCRCRRRPATAHRARRTASDVDVQPWGSFVTFSDRRRQHLGATAAATTVDRLRGSGTGQLHRA
jgi:hypothetical protein